MQQKSSVAALAAVLFALTAGASGHAEEAGPPLPPLPHRVLQQLLSDPQAWAAFRAQHATVRPAVEAPLAAPPAVAAPGWINAPQAGEPLSNPLLLTDGTVIAHVSCTSTWYKLTPNSFGSYSAGTWSRIASLPAGYAPRFFGSAVLSDGRVIVEGGEYNGASCKDVETNLGAIYNPLTNAWAKVAPPSGWKVIGDASAITLTDGRLVLSNANDIRLAVLNPASLTWTTTTPAGKTDSNNEENWTLLPNGDVLTVEAYTRTPCSDGAAAFVPAPSPAIGAWVGAGTTIHRLSGCSGTIMGFEAPTQILRPGGTVAAFGSTESTTNAPVYTAIYNTTSKLWASGPSMPRLGGIYYTMADAPAAVLPTGAALIAASPGVWSTNTNFWYPQPTHFFSFSGTGFAQVQDIVNAANLSSYEVNFLVLPTGGILGVETDYPFAQIFSNVCCASAGWAPTIASISSKSLAPGGTYSLSGTQLSGLTQGATYGDDVQADTNFPLVRIVNAKTGHVFYARTHGFTSRSVAPGAKSSTAFTLPGKIDAGASSLVVVANGIASAPLTVTVQ